MIQIKKHIFLFISVVSILFFIPSCTHQETSFTSENTVADPAVLRVSVDPGLPGYFEFNGEPMGCTYDLLDAYARSFGQTLEISSVDNSASGYPREAFSVGKTAMTLSLRPYSMPGDHAVIPMYETSYVVLATSKKIGTLNLSGDVNALLAGRKTGYSSGFAYTRGYDRLSMDPEVALELSASNVFEAFEELLNGRIDLLVCEKSEALLGRSLVRNIKTVYEFEEQVNVCMLPELSNPEEGRRFADWLYDFRRSEAASELYALYFEKGIAQRIVSKGAAKNRPAGSISVYDDLFKQVAEEQGLDWRLVSAIAYNESKYNAYLVSPRGARGLMQVMPSTARAFKVDVEELMDPEANVRVAVRLIREIEKSLKFSPGTSQEDRTSIMLACYNGGIGHVMDARRLASKYGDDPDRWSAVSRYLKLKSQSEYAEDAVVRCGRFRGAGETLGFVDHVMGRYYAYCGETR